MRKFLDRISCSRATGRDGLESMRSTLKRFNGLLFVVCDLASLPFDSVIESDLAESEAGPVIVIAGELSGIVVGCCCCFLALK